MAPYPGQKTPRRRAYPYPDPARGVYARFRGHFRRKSNTRDRKWRLLQQQKKARKMIMIIELDCNHCGDITDAFTECRVCGYEICRNCHAEGECPNMEEDEYDDYDDAP